MVVKAVILDFGGTLATGQIDWNQYHVAVQTLLINRGYAIDLNSLKKAIGSSLDELNKVRARGLEMTLEEVYSSVFRKVGLPASDSILKKVHDEFKKRYISTFFDCTRDVLEILSSQYKLALISNTMSDQPRILLEKNGMDHYFDVIICSRDLGIRKPNPAIFEFVLSKLKVMANEAAHVGDSIEADMKGAKNAGLIPIWIKTPSHEPWKGHVVSNICELPNFLEKFGVSIS
jgi:HAD superfamily hydrolase (TIGR01549 family)